MPRLAGDVPRSPAAPGAEAGRRDIVVDLDWRSVCWVLGSFVGLLAVTGVVRGASRAFTWIVLGTLLALALDPLVTRLKTRLGGNRSIAVGVVLASLLAAVAALAAVFGPAVANEVRDLGEDLPQVVDDLGDLPVVGPQLRDADVADRVERFLDEVPERLAGDTTPVEDAGRSVLGGALAAFATIFATVALLLDGERLLGRIRALVPPAYRDRADRVGRLGYRVVGQYFAGSVLVAAIAGIVVTAVGLLLGVPLAPLLGAWVAVFDLVPQIGGAVGGIPFVLLAFTVGPGVGLACAVFFILYLQFENHFLTPLVVGRSIDLSPPATMTAALVGVSAGGVVGAMLAVPLIGAAKAVYLELRSGGDQEVVGGDPGAAKS